MGRDIWQAPPPLKPPRDETRCHRCGLLRVEPTPLHTNQLNITKGTGGGNACLLNSPARWACDTGALPRYPSDPRLLHLSRHAHSPEVPSLAASHRCCCRRSGPPAVSLQQGERHAVGPAEAVLTSVLAAAAGGTRMQRIKLLVHAPALPPRCVRCLQVLLRQLGRQLCNWGGRSRQRVSRFYIYLYAACGINAVPVWGRSARTAPHTHPPAGPPALPPRHSPR